ncbi:MAG: outer membrane beta-barrel protein [Bacteroidales bacterium]|nr:outer membrane beta-barrel protein [Candidatus Cryptobacteroides equifaecalis]
MRKHTFIIVLLLCISTLALAQRRGNPGRIAMPQVGYQSNPKYSMVWGKVILSPGEEGGEEIPGTGAVISIAVKQRKDTLRAVANDKGIFMFRNVPTGKAYVKFSMMGYEDEAQYAEITPGETKMIANLKPKAFEIEDAVVTGKVAPVRINKDTIIFNAAAVKVNKGEKAIDILEQMPGVEVSESGVSVLNEDVKQVYIDGALLFGSAPMTALKNLDAEEVVTIKSYQEYANKDPFHKISKNESKQRVLDVTTRSKPKIFKMGNVFAGAGFDTDSTFRKFRYSLGGNANLFSEELQIHASANVNNINDGSNSRRGNSFRTASAGGSADLRALSVSAGVTKKWMSPTTRNFALGSVSGNYSFNENYDVNESSTQQIYFPDGTYNSREVLKRNHSESTSDKHNFQLSGAKALKDGEISLGLNYGISGSKSKQYSSNYNIQDGKSPQGSSSSTDGSSHGQSFSSEFGVMKGFRDKLRLSLQAGASLSRNDGGSAKIDTTTSTITYKVLDIASDGKSHQFIVNPNIRYELSDASSIGIGYKWSDTYSRTLRLATDLTEPEDPVTDLVNSYTYTTNQNVHDVNLLFKTRFEKIDALLHTSAGYRSTGMNRDETFPEPDAYDRRFNSGYANVKLFRQTTVDNWSVEYSTSASSPSLEQVRPKINNSNLYSVSAGNPGINQSRSHSVELRYSSPMGAEAREKMKNRDTAMSGLVRPGNGPRGNRAGSGPESNISMLELSARFQTVSNPIVRRQIYYADETYLPQYDYTMPAGSTFSTYENAPASYSASFNAKYSRPIEAIRCMMNSSLSFNWDSSPSYYNSVLTRTQDLRPSVGLGLRTNFSRDFRLNLGLNGSYIYSDNTEKNSTSYFTERINLGVEVNNILKYLYLGGNYYKVFTQGMEFGSFNDNIMNLNLGAKWGPKNEYDLALNVHDLFNTTTGFSTSMSSNYITNKWTHSFGRYVLLTFSYRFGQMGPGRRK